MASGEARKLHKANGLPVIIVNRMGRPQWSEVWDNVPYIARRPGGKPVNRLLNCPGYRPYIAGKTPNNWTWKTYKPTPAEIVFTPAELAFAEPYRGMVMIEPNVKANGHDNKAWVTGRWDELLDRIKLPTVQCLQGGTRPILTTKHALTLTFRQAAAVLSVAKAFVGTEGGLHHAAAAVGTPAVILWSEFISPEITGYATMTNLRHAGRPCGNRMSCPGCRKSMEAITVNEVVQALERILK
jgi:ADP-heptose:LPS heptosyltransferase